MATTDNYKKHTHRNPIQRLLLWNFFRNLLGLISAKKADSILDVGCGEGFTLNRLKEHGIGKRLEGVEHSIEVISLGKKTYPDIKIKQGNIYKLPYEDNSFDLVLCTEVLEHLDNPGRALKELVRVSNKYLVVSVPNEPFFMLAQLVRGKNWSRFGNDIEHVNHWTMFGFPKFVERVLNEEGAEPSEANPTSPRLRGIAHPFGKIDISSKNKRRRIKKNNIKITSRRFPFAWTMLLLEKA